MQPVSAEQCLAFAVTAAINSQHSIFPRLKDSASLAAASIHELQPHKHFYTLLGWALHRSW